MESEDKPHNPDVELKTYKILSKYLDTEKKEENDQNEGNNIEFDLPTPESLQKLCATNIVKDLLNFDLEKYSSYIEGDILNLNKVVSITDINMTKFLLMFLGYINSKNDIYNLFDESVEIPDEDSFIDYANNYLIYLNLCIDYLKKIKKFFNNITDLDLFLRVLSDIGIEIQKKEENALFTKIKKELFLSNEKNRILILLAPSNNFWIKSEKSQINDINYDKKLNNYSNIFYNKNFIQKFLERIVNNPRCRFGLISSMTYRNLKACWEALEKLDNQINELSPKNIILIDQNLHDQIQQDPKVKKKSFFRNLEKIIEYLKNYKGKNKDNEQDNTGYFNENNILILESEQDKMLDSTKFNSIRLNVFNEDYLQKDEKGKTATDLEVDKFIQYLIHLLNNCGDDIRTYIKQNPYII